MYIPIDPEKLPLSGPQPVAPRRELHPARGGAPGSPCWCGRFRGQRGTTRRHGDDATPWGFPMEQVVVFSAKNIGKPWIFSHDIHAFWCQFSNRSIDTMESDGLSVPNLAISLDSGWQRGLEVVSQLIPWWYSGRVMWMSWKHGNKIG